MPIDLFPAHAGVILIKTGIRKIIASFPRTRGGDPMKAAWKAARFAFSPHTRG